MKKVLITGASRGIGAAIAKKYIQNNYKVAINAIKNMQLLESTVQKYAVINNNVLPILADVSNYNEAEKMINIVNETFGGIDILINNAGISHYNLFTEDKDNFKKVIDTNLVSMFNMCHLVLPCMIQKKSGVIINISSIWGASGASLEVLYSASKGGVNAFTKALAKEMAPSGINVNAIAPGVIDTDMNSHLDENDKKALMESIPLGRFGEAQEVADLCYFLTGDEAKYITGQVITIDGGMGM